MNRDWNEAELSEELAALRFALIDLGMFLDTHPDNAEALRTFAEYRDRYHEMADMYTRLFGPISMTDVTGNNGWTWGITPLPWEGGL